MDKFFKIKERGSTVRTEIFGGVTTFFAMAYIMFVNPDILGAAFPEGKMSIFVATCIAAALGTILTAFLANAPFAQAPGMGLNAFFTFTVVFGMGYSFNQALAIVLMSGILFLIISLTPLRGKIIAAIPASLKAAIGAGIGLFIAFIGFLNTKLVVVDGFNNITGLGFTLPVLDEAGNTIGSAPNVAGLLSILGFIIIACLLVWKVKGAIVIGILATTIIGIPLGVTILPESFFAQGITLSDTFMKLEFTGIWDNGILPVITAVLSFLIVDLFDTVGTLVGTAGANGMLDKDGNLPGMDKAIIADAIATCAGAFLGTSTVTTYVESSTGISQGARTGLSSLTVGILFLASILLAPVALMIPGAATAPALIMVGVFMLKNVASIAWDNMEDAIPAFLTIVIMPFGYSISDGIAFGFISYVILKLVRGKAKEVPFLLYLISILFIAMYVLKALI